MADPDPPRQQPQQPQQQHVMTIGDEQQQHHSTTDRTSPPNHASSSSSRFDGHHPHGGPGKPSWHRYVRAPTTTTVHPVGVIDHLTCGEVENPLGMTGLADGAAVLRRGMYAPVSVVVLDFGQNTVGTVEIDFDGSERYGEPGPDVDEDEPSGAIREDEPGGATREDIIMRRPGLRLAFSETLEFLTDRCDFSRSYNGATITPGTDQIAVAAEPYTWTNTRSVRFGRKVASDGLHGFRYLRIALDCVPGDHPHTQQYGSVRIAAVRLLLSAYHGTPDRFAGWFECSDERLTQWWYDGVYTNDLCVDTFRRDDTEPRDGWSKSLDGKLVIHDAPKRDRDPYAADLAVAGLTAYYSRGPDMWVAARNVLADLALHQRADGWIPPASIFYYGLRLLDYPLWWVTCSYDLVMYTGDLGYAREHYPNLLSVLDDYYPAITNPDTGLIERGRCGTAHYGDYAFIDRLGPVTYYNTMYVRALRQASELARYLGHGDDEARWRSRARLVADALVRHNLDPAAGAFFDGTDEHGEYLPTHALDGNAIAVLERLVPPPAARRALAHFSRTASLPYGTAFYDNDTVACHYSRRVYAFISFFELQARFEANMPESALEGTRRLWGWMSDRDPGVTFWEGIGSEYVSPYTSMAHGWSTGVVALCSAYVLGVIPTGPGFAAWEVKPRVGGGVTWARGEVPLPPPPAPTERCAGEAAGERCSSIAVSWVVSGGGQGEVGGAVATLAVEVVAPAESSGIIALPLSFYHTLSGSVSAAAPDPYVEASRPDLDAADLKGSRVFLDGEVVFDHADVAVDGEGNILTVADPATASPAAAELKPDGFVHVRVAGRGSGQNITVRLERRGGLAQQG